jgi:hypothetical protein
MVLNQSERVKPTSPFKAKSWSPKWEKKHWLLVISIACIALWWFGSSLKESPWLTKLASYLPLVGSLAFASETILKLTQ